MLTKVPTSQAIKRLMPLADCCMVPLVYPAACILKLVRRAGVQRLPLCKRALLQIGVFPIRNHYYEPQFDMTGAARPFSEERSLPGIEWNVREQLDLLGTFVFQDELSRESNSIAGGRKFDFNNGSFRSGDAEYLYQLIRSKKPKRVYEVGSGNSTLMAARAIRANQEEDPAYRCRHVCIEPYEMPWLEKAGVIVVREKVEDIGTSFFADLEANDLLFIDSSHVIRPDGDVLFEYLELLPSLNAGVIVHAHDIFSPRNYLNEWLREKVLFWNEQYLLEAFLSHNASWKIIGALNYLRHNHYDSLQRVCPYLTPDREPGSFYIQKVA